MDRDQLKQNLKEQIIKYLNLLDFKPEDIKDDMPFFSDAGLALDSIDSLELIVMLEREYGIKITNPADGRKILVDINSMSEYILTFKKEV